MATNRWIVGTLALATFAFLGAEPAAAETPVDCVPQPAGTHPKEVVDYVRYVLVYWDSAVVACVDR